MALRGRIRRPGPVVILLAIVLVGGVAVGYGTYADGGLPMLEGSAGDADLTGNDTTDDETAATGGTSTDTGSDGAQPTDLSLSVDERGEVEPDRASMPGIDGGDPRPVGRLEDGDGVGADFVADEVIVNEDLGVARELADRWKGEVRASFDPAEHDVSGEASYLVTVDPSAVDATGLEADVVELLSNATGEYRVSDERSLKLLAAIAEARTEGYAVEANFVLYGDDVADGETEEAPTGPNSNRDAYDFKHLNEGETPAIGVTKAWEAMARADALDEEVRVAVLDNGFADHEDVPQPYLASGGVDQPNTAMQCTGGTPCPWHGTNVAAAAMAVPDNRYGTAGPAGPVAKPVLLTVGGDFYSIDAQIRFAADSLDADVVVISMSADMPGISDAFRGRGLEDATVAARDGGTIVVASAGNDGTNVDAERRFGFREGTDVRPCENDGVLCVGGLRTGSRYLHRDSNYGTNHGGSNTVDVYAPYCMWVGPTPKQNSDGTWDVGDVPNATSWGCGTSYSAPSTAGIVALVRAADPSLSAAETESILLRTAASSPDDEVHRIVDAQEAVRGAMGYNFRPEVAITFPADGESYPEGRIDRLSARVDDYEDTREDTPLSGVPPGPAPRPTGADSDYDERLQWEIDGEEAGTGTFLEISPADLPPGTHAIQATYTDAGGKTATSVAVVTVTDRPPHVEINSPTDGATFPADEVVTFEGTAIDQVTGESLPTSQITWHSDRDGRLGSGATLSVSSLTRGDHEITLRAEDDGGAVETESIDVAIVDARCSGDAAASASIANPADGVVLEVDHRADGHFRGDEEVSARNVEFSGWACDEDGRLIDGEDLTWMARYTYEGTGYASPLGEGAETSHALYAYENCRAVTDYTVVLDAWDESAGEHYVVEHEVGVRSPIC